MFSLPNHTRTRHKLIIGLDFGTTFSGVSYVSTDKSEVLDINIITTWPGAEQYTSWKTPTRIAYSRDNPAIENNKWGFEVQSKHKSYSWTKLLLDRNASVGDHDDPTLSKMAGPGILQLPHFRDALGVCEDFLTGLYLHMCKKLREEMTSLVFDNTPHECWITLPAIWSDEAKEATLTAAKNAGFGSRPHDEIFTIAEPEAAAIYTLKRFSTPGALNQIKAKENVLICDCGGGTTDLTTYQITQVSPNLQFDELLVGAGGKCGSTYIDRNLHALLSERFGAHFENTPYKQRGPGSKLMSEFEAHKRSFGFNEDRDIMDIGPITLEIPDSEHYDSEERMIRLSYEDMEGLFKPVVTNIQSLIGQQIRDARLKKNAKIERVILVGGFAESPYLFNELSQWCWKHGGDVPLIRPEQPQAAILRGAALRGLEGIAPRIKHARMHYGISMGMVFREGIDPERYSYHDDMDDRKLCDHRMQWLIAKGDEVIEGTSRTIYCSVIYTPGEAVTRSDNLYTSSMAEGPEYSTNSRVEKVGVIKSHYPSNFDYGSKTRRKFSTKLGRYVHSFTYQVKVIFGAKGSNLVYQALVDEKLRGTATIEFKQG